MVKYSNNGRLKEKGGNIFWFKLKAINFTGDPDIRLVFYFIESQKDERWSWLWQGLNLNCEVLKENDGKTTPVLVLSTCKWWKAKVDFNGVWTENTKCWKKYLQCDGSTFFFINSSKKTNSKTVCSRVWTTNLTC